MEVLYAWRGFWARPKQVAPEWDWDNWLILSGRAWGKTATAAQWLQEQIYPPDGSKGVGRVCIVARTAADIRDVCIEGESGLLAKTHPARRPVWKSSARRLTWPNGAIGTTFSAEEPDSLRGPQYFAAWCDELAAWRYAEETWAQLQMVLRLGPHPRTCISTTPRPTPLIRRLMKDAKTHLTHGITFENIALPPAYLARLRREFEGSRLARQELYAEILDDNPAALWQRARIDQLRVRRDEVPEFTRKIIAIDPAVTTNPKSNETGMIIAALGRDKHAYILDDLSDKYSPAKWGEKAVTTYRDRALDRIIGEVNQGGDLVENNVKTAAAAKGIEVAFRAVRATRGKVTRAEPVAALYEQGRVHHVGAFPRLEDQLCDWDPSGNEPSPDRLDALVWALTELLVGRGAGSPYRSTLIASREET